MAKDRNGQFREAVNASISLARGRHILDEIKVFFSIHDFPYSHKTSRSMFFKLWQALELKFHAEGLLLVLGFYSRPPPKPPPQELQPVEVLSMPEDEILINRLGQAIPLGEGLLTIALNRTLNDIMTGFCRSGYEPCEVGIGRSEIFYGGYWKETEFLLHWKGQDPTEAYWEKLKEFCCMGILDKFRSRQLPIEHVGHRCRQVNPPAYTWKIKTVEDCIVHDKTNGDILQITNAMRCLSGARVGSVAKPDMRYDLVVRGEFVCAVVVCYFTASTKDWNKEMEKWVIKGSVPAGYTAAICAARANVKLATGNGRICFLIMERECSKAWAGEEENYPECALERINSKRYVYDLTCFPKEVDRLTMRWRDFPAQLVEPLNGTHPTLAISELVRVLKNEIGLGWAEALREISGRLAELAADNEHLPSIQVQLMDILDRYDDNEVTAAVRLGIGTNAAYEERAHMVPKWQEPFLKSGAMVINKEWGDFQSSHIPLIGFDQAGDAESLNPVILHVTSIVLKMVRTKGKEILGIQNTYSKTRKLVIDVAMGCIRLVMGQPEHQFVLISSCSRMEIENKNHGIMYPSREFGVQDTVRLLTLFPDVQEKDQVFAIYSVGSVVIAGIRTVIEGGCVGNFSREQVELFCVINRINCSLESNEEFIFMKFRFALRDICRHAAFQLLHMVLEHDVWLEDAIDRATQLYLSYSRSISKSLKHLAAHKLLLAMLIHNERIVELSPHSCRS